MRKMRGVELNGYWIFTKPMKCIVPLIELDKEYTHFVLFSIKTQNVNSRENSSVITFIIKELKRNVKINHILDYHD